MMPWDFLYAATIVGMLVSFPTVAITAFKSKLVDQQEYGESISNRASVFNFVPSANRIVAHCERVNDLYYETAMLLYH